MTINDHSNEVPNQRADGETKCKPDSAHEHDVELVAALVLRKSASNKTFRKYLINRLINNGEKPENRAEALNALEEQVGEPEVKEAFIKILRDDDAYLRCTAAESLEAVQNDPEVEEELNKYWQREEDEINQIEQTPEFKTALAEYENRIKERKEDRNQNDDANLEQTKSELSENRKHDPAKASWAQQGKRWIGILTNWKTVTTAVAGLLALLLWGSGILTHSGGDPNKRNEVLVNSTNEVATDNETLAMMDADELAKLANDHNFSVGFTLHNGDKIPCKIAHSNPLKQTWGLHVAFDVKLVGGAQGQNPVPYELEQSNSSWPKTGNRREFIIAVTSNDELPGWPMNVERPQPLTDLFTDEELSDLQESDRNPDETKRNADLKRIVKGALDRRFGPDKCWFEIYRYKSLNKQRG